MTLATVTVSAASAQALRRGVPWCYRSELERADEGLAPGEVVRVVDPRANALGVALWAARSPVALRMLSRAADEVIDRAFWRARLEASLARRRPLHGRDAFRVVHGEADRLPGLFLDRYGDALTMQVLSEGMEVRKAELAELAAAVVGARIVVSRDDASGRDFEGLGRGVHVAFGDGPTAVRYHEGPSALEVDLLKDMKTGAFLDQVDNHLRAGELGHGEALDTFSYHGGFALALSRGCRSVEAVEQDATAAARARHHAELNGRSNVTVLCANAFDVLHRYADEGRAFDVVVVDPPGLAKRKEGMEAARRAYHELNLRAMKLVRPDGLLVSCSCSGKVSRATFEEILVGAAADARRQLQVLERRGPGIDHPPLATLPQSEYLKAWFLRVL